jgi:hypothetical protein
MKKEDTSSELEFYEQTELSSRIDVDNTSISKSSDSKAIDLIAKEYSFQETNSNHLHNSTSRKDMVSLLLPAFKTQKELHYRCNENNEKGFSKSLISRSSHVEPESRMTRNVLKSPFIASQECQQVSLQASIAKKFIDDEVPMDSAHHRKFFCTKKNLYKNYQKFHRTYNPLTKPLNRTYFNQLLDESKLTQVDTMQQCQYCFDLKNTDTITPDRLAKCFLHNHFRLRQRTAYLLDKKQLNEGIPHYSLFLSISIPISF